MRPIQRYSRLVEPEQVRYRLFVGLGLPTTWDDDGWVYVYPVWLQPAAFECLQRRRAASKIASGAVAIRTSQFFAGGPGLRVTAQLRGMRSALVPRPHDFQYCWRSAYLCRGGRD